METCYGNDPFLVATACVRFEGTPVPMPDTKILIVVKDPEAGHAYAEALNKIGAAYDIAASFDEMSCLAMGNAYNGLVIDILTLVRSSKEEKIFAYECINLYPVLRVKWENKKKKISLSPLEQTFSPDTESALRFFVENRCRPFAARSLRKHIRKNYYLNVLMSADGLFSEDATLKSFTLNFSASGAFLHTLQALERGQMVWLRFVEFPDLEPVAATVRWSLPWGLSRSIPGVGLKFERLSEAQVQMLKALASG
jgi:Tfp pilus assembly protein PilZ